MKKIVGFICAVFVCGNLFAFFDIFHSISRKDDGTENNIIRFTMPKALFELLGENQEIVDDMGEEFFFVHADSFEEKGISATIENIDDDFDTGFVMQINMDYNDPDVKGAFLSDFDELPFLYRYERNKIVLPLDFAFIEPDEELDDDTEFLLAMAQYKLLIDKSIVSNINTVVLKTPYENIVCDYIDLGKTYLVQLPMTIIGAVAVELEISFF
ncbi:hypothetical protein H0R92_02160 [Treponema sp. OMZ 840]|uniref:hypothetical protein n=1 Tax=Treponema sp. OMZ 840 TaxID=244313 RepID=UPI003D8EAF60